MGFFAPGIAFKEGLTLSGASQINVWASMADNN
jgi:hypothetical protein